MKLIKAKIEYNRKTVKSSLFGWGLFERKAICLGKLGTVLLSGRSEKTIRPGKTDIPDSRPENSSVLPWPDGDAISEQDLKAYMMKDYIDENRIQRAMDEAFAEPNPKKPIRTRALLVVYDGYLIAERYAPGFTRDTPLIGWSMKKSVINALIGILVQQGKLSIYDPAPVPEWQTHGDPRHTITIDQLLRMSSGLKFSEGYEGRPFSDSNIMLFLKPDMAAYAARKPLRAPPDTKWSYSSGTSNILARIIRQSFDRQEDYYSFPGKHLFGKIGMRHTILEPDASGTYVHIFATARDWARFGLLYLNDGVWNGERILPHGWVAYSTTSRLETRYGAQFWLGKYFDSIPDDLFYALGYQGQVVAMIPSRKLVIVRLGMTQHDAWPIYLFLKEILKALPF